MTGPDHETRPISVAELLARNGTIGAPPVGGRRRRRRGHSDAVTVAELTGEIPAFQDEEHDDTVGLAVGTVPSNGTAEPADLEQYPHEHEPGFDEHVEDHPGPSVAERMRPAPLVEDGHEDTADVLLGRPPTPDVLLGQPPTADVLLEEPAADDEDDDLTAYLRSIRAPLFGGPTRDEPRPPAHDDDRGTRSRAALLPEAPAETTRRDVLAEAAPAHEPDELEERGEPREASELGEHELPSTTEKALRAGLIVLQSIVAVAFGAGLFIAFDQLWKWNNIVALVLSVLVILGLVVAVRVVRKTEDIASTLIAVAVGALVTLGPLALLQSG